MLEDTRWVGSDSEYGESRAVTSRLDMRWKMTRLQPDPAWEGEGTVN